MDQKIDRARWGRDEIFTFFSGISNPFYAVCFRQDVTKLRAYTKANGLSFYHSLIWLCTKAINEIDAFRDVIRGGEVFRLDHRDPSFTVLKPGSEQFQIVTMPFYDSLPEFAREAKRRSDAQTAFIDHQLETDRLIYFSCLPWVDLTMLTNERDLAAPGAQDDVIPHIAWGKYVSVGDRLEVGMSVEVNHRLIDGVLVGRFAETLTRLIDALA